MDRDVQHQAYENNQKLSCRVDKFIESVYENKTAGRIESDMAFDMLAKYQAEKKKQNSGYDEFEARSESEKQDEKDVTEFISRLKRYAGEMELTREICTELVNIDVMRIAKVTKTVLV